MSLILKWGERGNERGNEMKERKNEREREGKRGIMEERTRERKWERMKERDNGRENEREGMREREWERELHTFSVNGIRELGRGTSSPWWKKNILCFCCFPTLHLELTAPLFNTASRDDSSSVQHCIRRRQLLSSTLHPETTAPQMTLIHIWRSPRIEKSRTRWEPYR